MFATAHRAYVPVRAEGHEVTAKGLVWSVSLQMVYEKNGDDYELDLHRSEVYYAELWDDSGNKVVKKLGMDEEGNRHGTEADWKEADLIDADIFDDIDGESMARQQFRSGDYQEIY